MRASGGPGSSILGRLHTRGESKMTQPGRPAPTSAALDYDSTIIGALEMSEKIMGARGSTARCQALHAACFGSERQRTGLIDRTPESPLRRGRSSNCAGDFDP